MRSLKVPVLALLLVILASAHLCAQPDGGRDLKTFGITNLEKLNTSADDYAPFVTPNGRWLYFTSSRNGDANLYRSGRSGETYSPPEEVQDQLINGLADDGIFSVPIPPLARLYYLDEATLVQEGTSMTGVMASGKRSRGTDTELYIFTISPDGATISDLTPLPELNSNKWESQPAISPDGRFIIFTSTRSGGEGGMDLYVAYREEGGLYGTPMNIGPNVNTDENEISPFIAPDGKTVYFSSNGHNGYGGVDIYMTQLNGDGAWSNAKNLGPLINTSANELFFYGVNHRECFFVSDRAGGKGGYDLYQAQPNPFMPGYATLHVQLRDSVRKVNIAGAVTVTEKVRGDVVERLRADEGRTSTPILSGYPYTVQAVADGYSGNPTVTLPNFPSDTTMAFVFNFGSELPPAPAQPPIAPYAPPPPPELAIDFEGINVPLFVSGYYRLNTPELLDDLRNRQENGDLKGQTYIADVANNTAEYAQYRTMSVNVTKIVGEFYKKSVDQYFPEFLRIKKPGEYLELVVYGYADPRRITGTYNESPVIFYAPSGAEVTVKTGEELDNFKLAGLRAYYAVQYLDQLFKGASAEGKEEYARLKELGAIRWKPVSGNVDDITKGNDLSEKRRIRVSVQVRRSESR